MPKKSKKKTKDIPRVEPAESETVPIEQNGEAKRRKVVAPSMKEMTKLLECPICLDVLAGVEIFQCQDGHHLCEACKDKLKICPTCQSPVTNKRNYGMESIADTFTFDCKNTKCTATLKGSQMKGHLKVCEYRPFKCFETDQKICPGRLVDISEFNNHLRAVHDAKSYANQINSTFTQFKLIYPESLCNGHWPISRIEFDGLIFLFNKKMKDKNMYLWITLIGSEAEAVPYSSQIAISNNNQSGKKRSIHSILPIHSHHFSQLSEVKETGDLFCLNTEQLETIFDKKEANKYFWDARFAIHKN